MYARRSPEASTTARSLTSMATTVSPKTKLDTGGVVVTLFVDEQLVRSRFAPQVFLR